MVCAIGGENRKGAGPFEPDQTDPCLVHLVILLLFLKDVFSINGILYRFLTGWASYCAGGLNKPPPHCLNPRFAQRNDRNVHRLHAVR